MVRITVRCLLGMVLAVAIAGCRTILPWTGGPSATAELKNGGGEVVGRARFTEVLGGVRIILESSGLPPGPKAVHIHSVGRCDPPDFVSAGDHFDPQGLRHGLLNRLGPHAGDLPNLTIEANGTGRFETTTRRITLGPSGLSILDDDGSTLVVHAGSDDFLTDPDGGSGARIACGVILESPVAAPSSD